MNPGTNPASVVSIVTRNGRSSSPDENQTLVYASVVPDLASSWERLDSIGPDVIALTEGPLERLPAEGDGATILWQSELDRGHPSLEGPGLFSNAILDHALASKASYVWFVHHDVLHDGSWTEFFNELAECQADFLAPCVRTRASDPNWYWWRFLRAPTEMELPPASRQLAALSSLFRVSREGLIALKEGLEQGWEGHSEATFSTIISLAGLTVEDLGGRGPFTPPDRKDRFYSASTFAAAPPKEYRPGQLHYPVPLPVVAPLPLRYRAPSPRPPRLLFMAPVGKTVEPLLPDLLERFRAANCEFILVQYEECALPDAADIRVIQDRGQKWQLARRHLDPAATGDFDYVFVWDDDIGIGDFDPVRFARIMECNRLSMAQPSIRSPHRIHYPVTAQKPCPPPVGRFRRVGRLTNFVEMMVPVFSRDAWLELHPCLDDSFRLGWGIDYLPLGNKGIVDCMHVVHTRPCNYHGEAGNQELENFLASQALLYFDHVEMGHLLEDPAAKGW